MGGVNKQSLHHALQPGERLLIDTSALIAYVSGDEDVSEAAKLIIDEFVRPGRNPSVISMVTVMELLVRPLQVGPEPVGHILAFLSDLPNTQLRSIDLAVAREAASLRAFHGLTPPDSLIAGTGLVTQARYLVTNDRRWSVLTALAAQTVTTCLLSDYRV